MSLEIPTSSLTPDQLRWLSSFNREVAEALDTAIGEVDEAASGSAGFYDVRDEGMTLNDTNAGVTNTLAFQALIDSIKTLGVRAKIYIPDGKLYLTSRMGVGDTNRACVRFQGHSNISIVGNGTSSQIVWQGDLQSTAKFLFWISGGYVGTVSGGITRVATRNIQFRDLAVMAGDITNRDTGSEQNHLFRLFTDQRGDVQDTLFSNIDIGWAAGGDGIDLIGDGGSISGTPSSVKNTQIVNSRFDGFVHAATVAPVIGFRSCVTFQRNTEDTLIAGCHMTGSDDQLIDFEPTGLGGNINTIIAHNTFRVRSPAGVAQGDAAIGYLAVTLSGNGNDSEANHGLLFAHNKILGGRLQGVKMDRCVVDHNTIETDASSDASPAIELGDRLQDIEITNNQIFLTTGCGATKGISITHEALTGSQRATAKISGNTVRMAAACTIGITVQSVGDLEICNNRIENFGTSANTGVAIHVRGTSAPVGGLISGNIIKGAIGGGTLERAITFYPDDNAASDITISNNVGNGSSGAAIRLEAAEVGGSYASLPFVHNNNLGGGVSVAAGINYILSGNAGGITMTVGGTASPEGVVTAVQGSTHVLRNGDSTAVYRKTTGTGNTGWVTP